MSSPVSNASSGLNVTTVPQAADGDAAARYRAILDQQAALEQQAATVESEIGKGGGSGGGFYDGLAKSLGG